MKPTFSLDKQVGGDHYKKLKIQPIEYIYENDIPFIEGCIIKYATRWREKGGISDLKKIIHFAEILIELEQKTVNPGRMMRFKCNECGAEWLSPEPVEDDFCYSCGSYSLKVI